MTWHFAPGGGTADWAAAAMAEDWTRVAGAQRSPDLAPGRQKKKKKKKDLVPPDLPPRAVRDANPGGLPPRDSTLLAASQTAPGTLWGAGAGPALSD